MSGVDMVEAPNEPGWYQRSSWASEAWERAQGEYWDARARLGHPWQPDASAPLGSIERHQYNADTRLLSARAEYRHLILGWYRKLCLPMKSGDCVPDEVANLLAEEWDTSTAYLRMS